MLMVNGRELTAGEKIILEEVISYAYQSFENMITVPVREKSDFAEMEDVTFGGQKIFSKVYYDSYVASFVLNLKVLSPIRDELHL